MMRYPYSWALTQHSEHVREGLFITHQARARRRFLAIVQKNTRFIAGCLRFFTFTQFFDLPA
jgi:hypothetical protein